MKRPVVNITPYERVGRVLVGAVGLIVAGILLTSAPSTGIAVLEVLLALAGLDMMVTGALGHCPLSAKLGTSRSHSGRRRCERCLVTSPRGALAPTAVIAATAG